MNKEAIKDLNDLRKELGISKEVFIDLMKKLLYLQKNSVKHISDEQMYLLIENILLNIDNVDLECSGYKHLKKSLKQNIYKGFDCFDNKK